MTKADFTQISKDVERINLHPMLQTPEARSHLHDIITTFVVTNNEAGNKVAYIQGLDTIASSLYVLGV